MKLFKNNSNVYIPQSDSVPKEACANVTALVTYLRQNTSGQMGSVAFSAASTISGVTIPGTWYTYLWLPHGGGGPSGGDRGNYGTLLLFTMTEGTNKHFYVVSCENQSLNACHKIF